MIVATIIKAILANAFVVFFIIAIVTTMFKVARRRVAGTPTAAYIAWGELLFYVYGLANIYGGFFHAYAGDMVAASIGWQPSPFQYELGWLEIGYGVTALFTLRMGYQFRFALTLPYSIFALAAAAQHITMMIHNANYATNNVGPVLWLGDIVIPLAMLILAWATRGVRS